MNPDPAPWVALVAETAAALRFQGELGLASLDLPEEVLTRRPAASGFVAAPEAQPVGSTAPTAPAIGAGLEPAEALAAIRVELGDCKRCRLQAKRTHIVFGVGDPRARLMFIGEGPGRDEDLQGEPFVGAAGQLLDKMIVAMTLRRSQVYIANLVKCRPPQNRDPQADEIEVCGPFLRAQIAAVKPEVIVALGRVATQSLLGETRPISRLRGTWREVHGIPLMPTFHPAYLLRTPGDKRLAWQDLQQVMQRLGLRLPRGA